MSLPTKDKKIIHKTKKRNMKKHFIHLFILPALLFYVLFAIYPIMEAFLNSFFEFSGYERESFIGLDNFKTLFTEEPFDVRFYNALTHNVIFLILTFVSQVFVAFFLAVFINSISIGQNFFKMAFFLPKLLAVVIVGFLFGLILNPNNGVLNVFLELIGLDSLALSWLGSPDTALISIILVHSWLGIGFFMLIILAGLQAIPAEVIEAAKIEGASGITMLRRITIPMVMPSLMIVSILAIIQSFEQFDLVFAMQGAAGGPYYSTDLLATFFYRLAFGAGEDGGGSTGLGSAVAVILFLIVATVSALSLFLFRRKEIDY